METKTKVSITLASDVLRAVDRAGKNRSEVIESWLRRAMKLTAEEKLRADTIAYYESLTDEERAEDLALAHASHKAARKVRID